MQHVRREVEVAVDLTRPERDWYEKVRADAGGMKASMGKAVSAHTLLSFILQMRQICSHGFQGQVSGSRSADASVTLPSNVFCTKCCQALPSTSVLKPSVARSGKAVLCLECSGEENGNLGHANDLLPTLDLCPLKRDISSPETENGFTHMAENGVEMSMDATSVCSPKVSSKIQSVVENLMRLGEEQNEDSTPTKRHVIII